MSTTSCLPFASGWHTNTPFKPPCVPSRIALIPEIPVAFQLLSPSAESNLEGASVAERVSDEGYGIRPFADTGRSECITRLITNSFIQVKGPFKSFLRLLQNQRNVTITSTHKETRSRKVAAAVRSAMWVGAWAACYLDVVLKMEVLGEAGE